MAKLWGILRKKHRIWKDKVVEVAGDDLSAAQEAVGEISYALDIPRPIWLDKHENEFETFRHTAFTDDHFVESIPFDRMEIEFLDDTGKKKRSTDPRNYF